MKIIDRIKNGIMGVSFTKFLLVHTSFLIMHTLPGVFINIFLLGQTDNMNVVLYYNAIFFISGAVCMVLAAYVLRRFNSGAVMVIGIVFYNLLYLMLLILGDNASKYYVLLGLTIGIADGFYWISYGHLLSAYTKLENRDRGVAMISFCGSIVNLIIPLFSGMLISKISGTNGYLTVFALAFCVAIVTALGALRLPRPPKTNETVQYRETLRIIRREKCLFYGLSSQCVKGIREGIFTFILSILLYKLVSNELLIGFNTFLSAIAAIISYAIMSKLITRNNRIKYMAIAIAVLFTYNLAALFMLSPATIILFTIMDSFFTGFIVNSCYSTYLDAIQVVPEAINRRPELLAMNEVSLITGRCVGLVVMVAINILSNEAMLWQGIGLLFLTVTQLFTLKLSATATKYINLKTSMG